MFLLEGLFTRLALVVAIGTSLVVDDPQSPSSTFKQQPAREHPGVKISNSFKIGPTIPGIREGVIPQGLAYWKDSKREWLLLSCYRDAAGKDGSNGSVVFALDLKRNGELRRCWHLKERGGKAHSGHVGGIAVSTKYLWIGGNQLFRVALTDLDTEHVESDVEIEAVFEPHCKASTITFTPNRIWVAEFVIEDDKQYKPDPAHITTDRKGRKKYAWAVGYDLDSKENLVGAEKDSKPLPSAVLSIRQKVQGMTFVGKQIVMSMSYGRKNPSTLALYDNPLASSSAKPHGKVEIEGKSVPLWFLDEENNRWQLEDVPPMSEGLVTIDRRIAVVFESGATKFQKGGLGPVDSILYFEPDRVR